MAKGSRTDRDIPQVWAEYKDTRSEALRNILMENYLHLVRYNAERIHIKLPDGVELDDLMSAGIFGLMDAIDAFDLDRGVKFETYCVPRIRGAMLDELRTMDWVPRLVRSQSAKMEAAHKQLEAQLGRAPTSEELAASSRCRWTSSTRWPRTPSAVGLVSLNKKWYETDSYKDVREIDVLEDKKGDDPVREMAAQGPEGAHHQGPQPERAADHHPLLLRGDDDEGDRRDARPVREPRQPDAQQHPRPPEGPDGRQAQGVHAGGRGVRAWGKDVAGVVSG